MSSITIHPSDDAPSYVVWSDGTPHLTPDELERAADMIGLPLALTPEGPTFIAGWDTHEGAAVLVSNLFPRDGWSVDPPIDVTRPEGVV